MSRLLPLLAFVALPAILTACDAPKSPLAKAKPGECYTVVGRDSLGKPTLAKTPCASSPEALAAACPPPATTPPAGCPPAGAKPAAGPGSKAATSVGQMTRNFSKRFAARTGGEKRATSQRSVSRRTTYAASQPRRYAAQGQHRRGESTEVFRDYRRVYTPAPQELYGPPPRQEFHADGGYQRGDRHAYREERREEAYAPPPRQYGYREEYRGQAYAPPPARDGYAYREERREHYAPPPVQDHGYREEHYAERHAPRRKSAVTVGGSSMERREAYSYRESSSSSSSHHSSSSAECNCPGARVALPPSPFDRDGYLTWRGKTPG